jgi:peroxiredoxin
MSQTANRQPRIDRLIAVCLAAGLLLPATASAGDTALATLLTDNGIRAVEPPSPAPDFTLPRLSGGQLSLSEAQGRWVLLTFFATWCGPCRAEMPSLEQLHRQRGDDGLLVLGVSVDDRREVVAPFVEQLGVTFPVLWDEAGRAAAAYRASSIPLTYLVDPQGRVAGVSRGARDWAALDGMLQRLGELVPADPEAQPVYAQADQPVQLPRSLTPPSADVVLSNATPRAGEPFYLDVRILWAGNFDDYLLLPPAVELPEGVEREAMSATTSTQDGRNVLTYRLTLRAAEPGSFALDPVELRYTPRFEEQPVARRIDGPTVTVAPFTVAGLAPGAAALAGGGALLGVGALVGLLLWSRRRRREGPSAEEQRYADLQAAFEEARRLRLAGDAAAFLTAIADLDRALGGSAAASDDAELTEALERARYAGQVPPPVVLDRFERRVARRLEELAPHPEQVAAKALRLAEQPQHRNP